MGEGDRSGCFDICFGHHLFWTSFVLDILCFFMTSLDNLTLMTFLTRFWVHWAFFRVIRPKNRTTLLTNHRVLRLSFTGHILNPANFCQYKKTYNVCHIWNGGWSSGQRKLCMYLFVVTKMTKKDPHTVYPFLERNIERKVCLS